MRVKSSFGFQCNSLSRGLCKNECISSYPCGVTMRYAWVPGQFRGTLRNRSTRASRSETLLFIAHFYNIKTLHEMPIMHRKRPLRIVRTSEKYFLEIFRSELKQKENTPNYTPHTARRFLDTFIPPLETHTYASGRRLKCMQIHFGLIHFP